MDQFAIGLFPLVYAGYAQMKIKGYKQVRNKPETIALKVKIGFQLQIAIVQIIELFIALLSKDLLSALCCLFLIIGLFYSFGITVIFHQESLLNFLPFIFLFNLICNEAILKLFDLLSLVLSSLLVIYQRYRGDDPLEYNPFCEFFEQQDSFVAQYLILLKFQPNTYFEEIELHELNESTVQDPLLVTQQVQNHQQLQGQGHQQQHPTSQVAQFLINQTRQSNKLDVKNPEPAIMDIVFSKDEDDIWDKQIEVVDSPKHKNKLKVRSSQIIIEENSQSEEISYPSFKEDIPKTHFVRRSQASEKRSLSQREIKQDHEQKQEQQQGIRSDDEIDKINKGGTRNVEEDQLEELKCYEHQSSNEIQPEVQQQQQIVDIDKLGGIESPLKQEPIPQIQQKFPFVEDNEYPDKLIVIPQQIQQELNKKKQQKKKKQKDEGLIAKRNRMIKRIKSFEEFQDKNDDNKSQNSDLYDDKKSDYERYKDELSSANLSEDESESGVYVQQKMEKVQFIVGRQVVKKLINYQHKTLIPITIKVKNDQWVQNCQYVELYQLANGHLPKPSYGDAELEKKLFYIQQWLDGMSQNPILMRKEILEFFNVPEAIMNKYGLVKKIEEETRIQRHSNKFMNSIQKEYFLQIKQIKVDCFNSEVSEAFAQIVYYSLRFTIQTEKRTIVTECKKTIEEIKEATKIIQQERNLRVSLQDHETVKKQMKAIDQFLQELFSHQFYYCDQLFEQFGLLSQIK
ncbi:unnamed protein product (macronuclear) [Paramecium tetraurelia]|uniref:PX domain-containing protein n=1 Tax=Paramecium tetraurelia TaxID=5888 RepID=A0C1L7_PARTE|nr:uncharacterized protein GSPATT00034161001 [Paramecium tetraurelia]CAK64684.1 unnamed protein product [Paramecium tetraurelia]|eukprot:XP_001432081.1 hypothetical protein (macronuclear) [Paramecium tetraurelia strain d4-2]